MKNMMIALFGVLMLPLASFALDCKNDGGPSSDYSHCTEFVDNLSDPMHVGYQMEMTYLFNNEPLGTMPVCMSSDSILETYMENAPGEYTQIFNMGYSDANGNVEYKYLTSQAFVHTGNGPASPAVFTVHLNPGPGAVTCDRSVSSQATELQEYIHIK